ncbi:hypothetical protein ACB092_07G106400 [Castanea dentata]
MAAQSIVRQGTWWQVGNGRAIEICKDKWLHEPSTFRLTSQAIVVPSDAKVSLLINPHIAAWRTDTVQQFFSPDDAVAILSIPLSYRLPMDRLVWAYTPRGVFTVRSVYKVALSSCNNGLHGVCGLHLAPQIRAEN